MNPTPYLFFNGECAEAISAYAKVFGGEVVEKMPATDMPAEFPVPGDKKHWIMHSRIMLGEGYLMASDNLMGTAERMAGSSVMVSLATAKEGKAAFDKLSDQMPWAPTFWSAGFGTLTDRFGAKWMIGCDEQPE